MFLGPKLRIGLIGSLLWASPQRGAAQQSNEAVDQCLQAHVKAQVDIKAQRLTSAATLLRSCAASTCPQLLREDCARVLGEVSLQLPSVKISVRDATGAPMRAERVVVDGKLTLEVFGSRTVELDPGPHTLELHQAGQRPGRKTIQLEPGQKEREVAWVVGEATREPTPAAPQPVRTSKSPPVAAIVLSSVAGVGLITGAAFALSGRAKESDLEGTCAPYCEKSEYDDLKRRYLVADIVLGSSLLVGGIAVLLWTSDDGGDEAKTPTLSMRVRPSRAGGSATFQASF